MKKYYSTTKEYKRVKIYPLFYHIIKALVRPFIKKSKVIFEEEVDRTDPVVFVSNHAMLHGPINMLYSFPYKNYRPWTTFKLCFCKEVPKHIMTDAFPKSKGLARFFLTFFSYLLTPLIVYVFRAIESIPVYTAPKILITYKKTIQTLKEGKDIYVFPESPEYDDNCKFVQKFHTGFTGFMKEYYRETGKCIKFYPLYVCHEHHVISVGKPEVFDPDFKGDQKEQMRLISQKLQYKIEALAQKLPPHKFIVYNGTVEERPEKQEPADKADN